jgi:hypothetical protein
MITCFHHSSDFCSARLRLNSETSLRGVRGPGRSILRGAPPQNFKVHKKQTKQTKRKQSQWPVCLILQWPSCIFIRIWNYNEMNILQCAACYMFTSWVPRGSLCTKYFMHRNVDYWNPPEARGPGRPPRPKTAPAEFKRALFFKVWRKNCQDFKQTNWRCTNLMASHTAGRRRQ